MGDFLTAAWTVWPILAVVAFLVLLALGLCRAAGDADRRAEEEWQRAMDAPVPFVPTQRDGAWEPWER